MRLVGVVGVVLVSLLLLSAASGKTTVEVRLEASWPETSAASELSEFLASAIFPNSSFFWQFLSAPPSGLSVEAAISHGASLFPADALARSLLDWSLSTRHYSPLVEAQRQTHRQLLGASRTHLDVLLDDQQGHVFRLSTLEQVQSSLSNQLPESQLPIQQLLLFPSHIEHCLNLLPDSSLPLYVLFYDLDHQPDALCFQSLHQFLASQARSSRLRYCFRHGAGAVESEEALPRLLVQGFQAELWLKSLEYKAINLPSESLQESAAHALSPENDADAVDADLVLPHFEALNMTELGDLGFRAATHLSESPSLLSSFLFLSQNFPLIAPKLAAVAASPKLAERILGFRQENSLHPGAEFLTVNGRALDLSSLDPFSLYEVLLKESLLSQDINTLPLSAYSKQEIPYLESKSSQRASLRFDVRSPAILWLNDLQKDPMYQNYPKSLSALLSAEPFNPFRPVAKNALNLVLVMRGLDLAPLGLFAQVAQGLIQGMPLRVGLVISTSAEPEHPNHQAEMRLARAFNHVFKASSKTLMEKLEAFFYLFRIANGQQLEAHTVNAFLDFLHLAPADDASSSEISEANKFLRELGFGTSSSSPVFLNGMLLDSRNLLQAIMTKCYFSEYPLLEEMIRSGQLTTGNTAKSSDIYDVLLSSASTIPKYNAFIAAQPFRSVPLSFSELRALDFLYLTHPDSQDESVQRLTYHIIADLATIEGSELAYASISKFAGRILSGAVRVAFFDVSSGTSLAWRAIHAALQTHSIFAQESALKFSSNFLLGLSIRQPTESELEGMIQRLATKHLKWPEKFQTALASPELGSVGEVQTRWVASHQLVSPALLLNGRLYHFPAEQAHLLTREDFDFLDASELNDRVYPILGDPAAAESSFLEEMEFSSEIDIDDRTVSMRSDVVVAVLALLSSPTTRGVDRISFRNSYPLYSSSTLDDAVFTFDYVADPLGASASRVLPILTELLSLNQGSPRLLFRVNLYLNPAVELSKLPLQRFSRYAIRQRPSVASFEVLPQTRLLTLQLQHPPAWLVQSTSANADLDNILLNQVQGGQLLAGYRLDHLLFQGSCADDKHQPPQGLQMTISPDVSSEVYSDTLVMINLGYFQLKAEPGLWTLRMAPGRARMLYQFAGELENATVSIHGWSGVNNFALGVTKRLGMEEEDLIENENENEIAVEEPPSMWESLTGFMSQPAETSSQTIHVFSLASGHLYERFLKIMILSVLDHTKSPVKFWLLKNYLSPEFKEFLPHMAQHLGFEYEFVTYQWPHWLRAQTEKQRILWAYKILFLDVLFPLNLDRVIFVDADQIVRTDLKELMEMDLHGAPYGYTPFCESRSEMDGFRFWKQGFWETHLRGRPYHISALYVIDLKRFRRIAAGDQLRATYDGLSADPNSLANLDQDLPNYLQHHVRIFSLPQEWLWCETWCDDESLATAKTIDLCNNPLTKTPKLDNAVRIVPEWTSLDDRVKHIEQLFQDQQQKK